MVSNLDFVVAVGEMDAEAPPSFSIMISGAGEVGNVSLPGRREVEGRFGGWGGEGDARF